MSTKNKGKCYIDTYEREKQNRKLQAIKAIKKKAEKESLAKGWGDTIH